MCSLCAFSPTRRTSNEWMNDWTTERLNQTTNRAASQHTKQPHTFQMEASKRTVCMWARAAPVHFFFRQKFQIELIFCGKYSSTFDTHGIYYRLANKSKKLFLLSLPFHILMAHSILLASFSFCFFPFRLIDVLVANWNLFGLLLPSL